MECVTLSTAYSFTAISTIVLFDISTIKKCPQESSYKDLENKLPLPFFGKGHKYVHLASFFLFSFFLNVFKNDQPQLKGIDYSIAFSGPPSYNANNIYLTGDH